MMEKKFFMPEFGYELTLGKFAGQADGAAWLQQGGTVVLTTACSAPSAEFPGFLPLTVDYREQFSAAGKIPGGYFKREGKFSDKEVLSARLIDRAIRPLFPQNYFNAVQILTSVYSVDKENPSHILGLLATSIALAISKIPFLEPVGAIEMNRVNGSWIANATFQQALTADAKITVAGTFDGIVMVEGSTKEISEQEFIDVLFLAHEKIKAQVVWQQEIQRELNTPKEAIVDQFDFALWKDRTAAYLTDDKVRGLFVADKNVRSNARDVLEDEFFALYKKEAEELAISKTFLKYIFDTILKEKITELCFVLNKRIDTRDFSTVRAISSEIGLLPHTHGSALFQRGATQALVTTTLGGGQDEVRTEDIMGDIGDRRFMLHYNFPPFSVGEVRPQRGPGRREVGHGYLAQSAIKHVLPVKDAFPYTIRIVADILSSDGSSSMATVCGTTLSLMDTGVPITNMVSGVAMGLLRNKTNDFRVLTDIAGIEDEFGLMDFKVAGTDKGITAIQMDIKYKGGLTREIFEKALAQAKDGRLHILNEMHKTLTVPRAELSPLVPQMVSFKIAPDKIGAVIGSGGKVIRDITEKTSTTIDTERDGTIKIFGAPGALIQEAISWVKILAGQIEPNAIYKGKIKRTAAFGIFVEIAPGVDGLVHVSSIPRDKQESMLQKVQQDEPVTVQVIDYDETTGRIRLKLVDYAY